MFLAPKVYSLLLEDGTLINKVKGMIPEAVAELSNHDFEALLEKDSKREFIQEKWYKKATAGEISVADIAYTLSV